MKRILFILAAVFSCVSIYASESSDCHYEEAIFHYCACIMKPKITIDLIKDNASFTIVRGTEQDYSESDIYIEFRVLGLPSGKLEDYGYKLFYSALPYKSANGLSINEGLWTAKSTATGSYNTFASGNKFEGYKSPLYLTKREVLVKFKMTKANAKGTNVTLGTHRIPITLTAELTRM